MRICHFVGHSLVRYTPARIACYWGRYTEHEGQAFAISRGGGRKFAEPLNPYGFYLSKGAPKSPLEAAVEAADVLHFHDDSYPSILRERYRLNLKGKRLVYQAHIGNIPERYFARVPGKFGGYDTEVFHTAITNGYGHLFDADEEKSKQKVRGRGAPPAMRKWGRLPDVLDLHHPAFHPEPDMRPAWDADPLVVVYTYSNNREGNKINAKRPKGHIRLLHGIKGIQLITAHGKPFEEAMALKKRAHVVLEEVFTPYLHLSALEGAGVGACVVTQFNRDTVRETSAAIGAPESAWPFVQANERTLARTITKLRDDRQTLRECAERASRWAWTYYTPERLLKKYLEAYEQAAPATR